MRFQIRDDDVCSFHEFNQKLIAFRTIDNHLTVYDLDQVFESCKELIHGWPVSEGESRLRQELKTILDGAVK
jgi:hypothetical protein